MTTSFASQPCDDIPTIAKRWGVSSRTVRRLISSKRLGVVRILGAVRIPLSEQERFLRESFNPPAAVPRKSTPSLSQIVAAVSSRRKGGA